MERDNQKTLAVAGRSTELVNAPGVGLLKPDPKIGLNVCRKK